MRDFNVINEILSMRSRMWCRWHITDKPPQNETRQVDTMGNHPLNMAPRSTAQEEREGGPEGRVQASLHVPSRQAHARKAALSTVSLPPTNALVVTGTVPCWNLDDIHVSLFSLVSAVPLIVISDKWIMSTGCVS